MDEDIEVATAEAHHLYHKKRVLDISYHPRNNDVFATCSEDKSVVIWNRAKGQRIYNLSGHSDIVTSVSFNTNGNWLASCSKDETVRFWQTKLTGQSFSFRAHASSVNCLDFTCDSSKLVTGSNDKSLKLWEVKTKQFLTSLVGHNNWVNCVKASKNGFIVSTADDKCIKIWDPHTRDCVHTFLGAKSIPKKISVNPNGNSIAVGFDNGSVRIYDCRQRKLQQHYVLYDETACVEWHPFYNYLLTASLGGNFVFVDVMEGRPVYLSPYLEPINCIKFSPDGEHFISSENNLITVWRSNLKKF